MCGRVEEPPQIAIISDEPTPYRLHVLRRIAREIPEVAVHNVFTHPVTSMPWQVGLDEAIRPVTFPRWSLNQKSPFTPVSLPLFLRIRDLLAQRRIRMLVLLGYNNLTLLMLMHWARRRRIPLALTGDSNIFNDSRHGALVRGLKQLYLRHVVGLVSAIMPMGTCGRAYYRLYANHSKPTFLFPYEPDYARFEACDPARRDDFLARHGLDPARRRIVFSGRLVPVKRVDVLLDAFARILPQRPAWDLVIAGDGPLREQLASRLPEAARPRVHWVGFLQVDELASCYHASAALVLPSEREPWGLVVNEAVAAGLAVVATEVSGAAVELVRHGTNGLLVPPGNVDALADALLEATDEARNRALRSESAGVLRQWRACADPVAGLRELLRHFQLLPGSVPCPPKP